jgi:hypothetical protein
MAKEGEWVIGQNSSSSLGKTTVGAGMATYETASPTVEFGRDMAVDFTGATHPENLGATDFNRLKHYIEMFKFSGR